MKFEINLTPRSEREAIISKSVIATKKTSVLDDFRGDRVDLPEIKLEISLPVYRMANCRTFSEQQSVIAKKELDKTLFSMGQESSSVQQLQHEILRKITKAAKASIANIDEVLEVEGQREPILITATGVVVNGNRRLSAMRDLYALEKVKFAQFAYIRCAVLPADTSPDEIDDIEAALQARPQTKLDYDWIGDAQLVRRQINKKRTPEEVADQLRRRPVDIKNLLQALREAELYLSDWRGKPGQYGLVSDDAEQLFKDLPKNIAGQGAQLQNASRAIAWSLFDNREKLSGRVYGYNAAFGKLAPEVIQTVVDELGLELEASDEDQDEEFDFAIDEDEGAVDYQVFVDALKDEETKDDTVETLIDACVTAIERDKGKKNKNAALKALGQVHSKLAAIDVSTAGTATYPAMLKQIEAISEALEKLRVKVTDAIAAGVKPKDE